MLRRSPAVVPVVGERTGEEISVRTNGRHLPEPPAKPTEKVLEPVEGSRVIPVTAVVMWPQRIEEGAGQDQEVETPVLIE